MFKHDFALQLKERRSALNHTDNCLDGVAASCLENITRFIFLWQGDAGEGGGDREEMIIAMLDRLYFKLEKSHV